MAKERVTIMKPDPSDSHQADQQQLLSWLSDIPVQNPNPILEINLEGRVEYCNPAAKRLFPTLETLQTTHPYLTGWEEILDTLLDKPEDQITRDIRIEDCYYQQSIFFMEKFQRLRIYGLDITELKQTQRALEKTNLTLRQQAEELVIQNEELHSLTARQRDLLQIMDKAHILVRDQEDKIIYWNQGAQDLYLFTEEEALGKISHQLLRTVFSIPLKEILAVLNREGKWEGELVQRKKDGSEVFVASQWYVYQNNRNQSSMIIEVNNDITVQKQLERSLEEANAYLERRVIERTQELRVANEELQISYVELENTIAELETAEEELKVQNEDLAVSSSRLKTLVEISQLLVESGPNYLVVLDAVVEKISEIFNAACVLRLLSENGLWLNPVAFFHPDPIALKKMESVLTQNSYRPDQGQTGKVFETGAGKIYRIQKPEEWAEWIALEPAGSWLKLQYTNALIVPLRIKNKNIGTLGLISLSDGKLNTQEELLLLQELADRVATAIYNARLYQDLEKSYLNEKLMRKQLIQTEKYAALARLVGSVAHEINNPLQTVQNCLFLLQSEIDADAQQILDMALSETNRMSDLVQQLRDTYRPSKENQAVQLDITEVLEKVRALLSPQLRQNNITWSSQTKADNTLIKGKPDQLKQVFLNVCLNGIDAMGNKGGTLTVTISEHLDRNRICVSFRDTGPGISKKNLNQIFEPFFTTKEKGTGLGLAISYEIVKEHNGEITVESRSGKGSTFNVWLPIEV